MEDIETFVTLLLFFLIAGGVSLALLLAGLRKLGILPSEQTPATGSPSPRKNGEEQPVKLVQSANAPAVDAPPVAWAQWVRSLATVAPHIMVVGASGSGKSTLARALLAMVQPSSLIILDPHASPSDWQGIAPAAIVGAARNYEAISTILDSLRTEMSSRYSRRAAGDETYLTLWIVCDEIPAIAANCTEWGAFINEIAAEGRKVRMTLCALTQSPNVTALGIEGRSDTKLSFARILLGEHAKPYRAALDLASDRVAIDTTQAPRYAAQPVHSASYEATEPQTDTTAQTEETDNAPEPAKVPPLRKTDKLQAGDKAALIRYLVGMGWGLADIRSVVKGDNGKLSELYRAALDEQPIEA